MDHSSLGFMATPAGIIPAYQSPSDILTHLQNLLVILRGVEPPITNNVFYELLVVLCQPTGRKGGEGARPTCGPLPCSRCPPERATGSPALSSSRSGELENPYLILKALLGQYLVLKPTDPTNCSLICASDPLWACPPPPTPGWGSLRLRVIRLCVPRAARAGRTVWPPYRRR